MISDSSGIFDFLEGLRDLVFSPFISHPLLFMAIGWTISALFIFLIFYLPSKTDWYEWKITRIRDFIAGPKIPQRRSIRSWQLVQKRMSEGGGNNWKMAILLADEILTALLKASGYKGKTVEERLEQVTPAQLSNIEEVKNVHRVRDKLIHEPGYLIDEMQAKAVIDIYQRAFQEWGLID